MRNMVAKRATNKRSKQARKTKKLTAKTADRHWLYQQSVQAPDVDSKFLAPTRFLLSPTPTQCKVYASST